MTENSNERMTDDEARLKVARIRRSSAIIVTLILAAGLLIAAAVFFALLVRASVAT